MDIGAHRQGEVLLHLSDVHFGADHTAVAVADRATVLRSLVSSLDGLEDAWRPSIVATTGDVGWAGKDTDYQAANTWFAALASALEISHSNFLFIPGNHDVDRGFARTLARAQDHEAADRIFENGVPEHYQKPFDAFVRFCRSFNARPYSFQGAPSYLLGATTVGSIRFVGVNTCWFSQGHDDQGKLRLSLGLMKLLEADASLIQPGRWEERPVTVALMHHPQTWLHPEEISDWNVHGQASFLYLASRVHLLLCGHTHEMPREHGKVTGGGIDLRCGASFAGAAHPNTYQLIRFRSDQIEYRQFQLENRPTAPRWRSSVVVPARFSEATSIDGFTSECSPQLRIEEVRARLATYAADHVQAKSRALTPKVRPKLYPQRVEIRVESKGDARSSITDHVEQLWLEQVIADTPRLLIWGDLGTGKSTLVGMFAEKANRDGDTTAVLVPATQLMPAPSTVGELLQRVSHFVHGNSFPERDAFDLRVEALASSDETVLIVDGLDEIDNRSARKLLTALTSLPEFFPRVRVMATSRAVGHEYELGQEWPSATMATLLDEERRALLIEVARATGLSVREAEEEAKSVLLRIGADAILEEAARSPMALRLMYRELSGSEAHRDRSLGEMLYRLLEGRLLKWEDADEEKGRPTPAFCEALPGAHGRLELLSALAIAIYDDGPLSVERAAALLRAAPALHSAPEAAKAQALKFFEWTNLIRIANDSVEFALRPFLEIACAPSVLERLGRRTPLRAEHWRIVAFAAAIGREHGKREDLRPALLEYIRSHNDTEAWLLAACYIAAESRDEALARDVVSWRSQRPFERPLFTIAAERRTSAAAVAMTIYLAGDPGFEWFHASYLDPRYPILHRGSGILENIFEHWVSLQGDHVSPKQAELLAAFPSSHLATNSAPLLKLVPLAVLASPGSLAPRWQASLLVRLLTHSSLSSRAETTLRRLQREHADDVQDVLWGYVLAGHENAAKAAELWLEVAPVGHLLPVELIAVALRSRGKWDGRFFSQVLWDISIKRLGVARWERFCRWQLSEADAHDAMGAALHLIAGTPELVPDLREVLLNALSEGHHTAEAEPLLLGLAEAEPLDTARWLARRIAEHEGMAGAPGIWWRLFLSVLSRIGEDGPPCLAVALSGVGSYAFSRHAYVRRLARQLGRSAQGDAYVKVLEEQMRRGASAQRYGAATILICIGASLGEALLVCARARLNVLNHSWEWDRYCLSLRFPAAAIDHVFVQKDLLPREAKLFVLCLAEAHGRELKDADLTFVAENADRLHNMAALERLLSRETTFRHLEKAVVDSHLDVAATAASVLLHRHAPRLNVDMRVRCELLASNNSFGRRFRAFESDASARDQVIRHGRSLAKEYGQIFAQAALAEASADPKKWRDALSILFRREKVGIDHEFTAWEILIIGKEFPRHCEAIGAAARRLCVDRTLDSAGGPVHEAMWLVFLAHEFGAVDATELLGFVNPYSYQPELSSIRAALAARIPDSKTADDVPNVPAPSVVAESLDDVGDSDRDSATKVCESIPRTLYREHDPVEFEQLAARGARARLIAAILQYLHGLAVEPSWLLKIIGSDLIRPSSDGACHLRLRALTRQAFRGLVREHPEQTRTFLHTEIMRAKADCLDAGMLVLSASWSLSTAELAVLLFRYSEIPYPGWRPLLRLMIAEAAKALDRRRDDEVLRRAVSQSLEQLTTVNGLGSERDPLALIVYACLAWLVGAESAHANAAFREGLAGLSRGVNQQRSVDLLAEAVELLKRVDPQRIREALTSYEGEKPALVAIALLLSSFFQ